MDQPPVHRPCRRCGVGTAASDRVCWPCKRCARESEDVLPQAVPAELRRLWSLIVPRYLIRRAIADRARCGLTPLEPHTAVVVEFERRDGASRFATFSAETTFRANLGALRHQFGLGPPDESAPTRVHDGRELFSADVNRHLRGEHAEPRPPDGPPGHSTAITDH